MKRSCLLLCLLLAMSIQAQTLQTRWAKGVTPENAHREYPRPQMTRKDWVNLNGLWNLKLTKSGKTEAEGTILVPFPPESQLSGFHHAVAPGQELHYSRHFQRPKGDRVLLHFGASDWETLVVVNGEQAFKHRGGYDPFTADITDALKPSGDQLLEVIVTDPSDKGYQPRGKQVVKPGGIFYTPTSGIWQTVWLEPVPASRIGNLKIDTWPKAGQVQILTKIDGAPSGLTCKTETLVAGKVVATSSQKVGDGNQNPYEALNVMKIRDAVDWTPENPHLYDLRVTLLDEHGHVVDQVGSYFGLRENSLIDNGHGQPVVALNGKPYFLIGPLDQGFWPDGLYTAPSDEAMKYDLEITKRLGFNMIRKHVKVEPARWYYWCDKLGIAVIQDMPSGDKSINPDDPDIQRSEESATNFKTELQAMVDTHYNYPCIVSWVLYNEGWGQWDTPAMAKWLHEYDPTRLINATTGWADRKAGSFLDYHIYPGPGIPPNQTDRAIFLGEFGGLGLPTPGHMWKETGWGYQSFKTSQELTDKFVELFENLRFLKAKGLSGAVYTQTTDVETELNGLMTYDRAMIKLDEARTRKAITDLFLPAPVIENVLATSEDAPMEWRYRQTSAMPNGKWVENQLDDSAWPTGPGGFGTPDTPGSIVRTRWDTNDIYLRHRFTLDRDHKAGELRLRLSHDDDVEVYLDGQQIYKASGYTTSYHNLPLPVALAKGEHLIAIHCHQDRGGQYVDAGLIRVK